LLAKAGPPRTTATSLAEDASVVELVVLSGALAVPIL
jgi:hypothetical protein